MALALVDDLLAVLLPGRCAGCGARGAAVCPRCERRLRAPPPAPPPPGVDWWTACFAYEGVGREVVARAKYRGERAALHTLAHWLAAVAMRAPRTADLVTWAPASAPRYARHGVDHAAVIARVVARELHVPARALLARERDAPQTGRDAASRRAGPRVHVVRSPAGMHVLVVDDVATTGGTLAAVAGTLRMNGARSVQAATIARTPRPDQRVPAAAYTPTITPS